MKRLALVLVVALALSGCGDAEESSEVFQKDVNGKAVTCVAWKSGYAGGLDCNWEGFNGGS